jgi:hypothetical protein
MVFVQMTSTSTYDVAADRDLMRLLRTKVEAMQGVWKETTRRMLAAIEKPKEN